MRQNFVETLIGMAVVAIAVLFVVYGYSVSGTQLGSDSYIVRAEFDGVDGLGIGSDVRLAGIKIGSVEQLRLDAQSYRAQLRLRIRNDIRLPDDSSIKVTSSGLLGEQYLAVLPGGSEDYLHNGDEIVFTQGAVDLIGLVGQAMFSTGGDDK